MRLEILEYIPIESTNSPPLLFVHGAYHGAWCWEEHFLPYFFSKGFSCYALSLRGHGESEGFEELQTFSLNDYVDDVLEVMARIKEKSILIGHSMGGAVVQKIAHICPDKIAMVILLASVPPQGIAKEVPRLFLTHLRAMLQLSTFNQGKGTYFPTHLFLSKNQIAGANEKFARLVQPESARALGELQRSIVPVSQVRRDRANLWCKTAGQTGGSPVRSRSMAKPLSQDIPQPLHVPLLVIGSKKDAVLSEKTVRSIGKAYNTRPIIFSDISHDMMLDPQWRRVADRIHTFLSETVSTGEKGRP